jgi:hypothetical protein
LFPSFKRSVVPLFVQKETQLGWDEDMKKNVLVIKEEFLKEWSCIGLGNVIGFGFPPVIGFILGNFIPSHPKTEFLGKNNLLKIYERLCTKSGKRTLPSLVKGLYPS